MERWPVDLSRMNDVFGASPQALTEEHIQRLVDEQVREADDLDFKRTSYYHDNKTAREKGKLDLACDVTALANDQGGVIVIGVDEKAEVASALCLASLDPKRLRWMREVIAKHTQPHVDVGILPVPSHSDPTEGWIVIAVATGTRRPYATDNGGDYLRFPRRHGTTTRNMREAEIADLYRGRFAARSDAEDRGRALLDDPKRRIEREDSGLVSIALAPCATAPNGPMDPGARDRAAARLAAGDHGGNPRLWTGFFWQRPEVSVGHRRIVAVNDQRYRDRPLYGPYAELHADGASFASYPLSDIACNVMPRRAHLVLEPTELSWAVARSLRVLADHARDGAGIGGEATLHARLGADTAFTIGFYDPGGFPSTHDLTPVVTEDVEVELSVSIDAILRSDTDLLATTSMVTGDLLQSFAIPEDKALTRAGALRHRWVPHAARDGIDIEAFAASRGVALDESSPAAR